MAKKSSAAHRQSDSPAPSPRKRTAKLSVVKAEPAPAPKPNVLIRHGDRVLEGVRNSYRPDPPPAGAGRIHRAFHVGADVLERRVFQVPMHEAARTYGLAVKGTGHAVAGASKLSAQLHAKNASKVSAPVMNSAYGAMNVVGMGTMAIGLGAAGLSRAAAAHDAGASKLEIAGAGARGVLEAAKVPIGVGLGLAAVGKFAGLGTSALLGKHLFMGSLAYNVGSRVIGAVREGKGGADIGRAALSGVGNTLYNRDAMVDGVKAWKHLTGGQDRFDPHAYAAANDRYKAMRAAAGETDLAKRRKGWSDAARIGAYNARVPGGSNAPYGGQARAA